ncbi:hypothetical protein GBAR_LOCUS16765 [Geodia barretti]|uniref:NADH dehydrogenase [ubiquinone] 1 alpha subcomplex subunit 11 n=1 Tax=Geodia barretti TaxID=519541 RepID=A0AA35SI19_GEOBA|nr:hypothetical protein GBAR_LOCUS16765 [Geodia barretti]
MSDKKEIEVELGDNGAGTHCDDQFMRYAGGGAVAGACFGAVEACLVNPVPGQTTPLIFKAFKIMGMRSVLVGTVGGVFAVGACFSAKLRDRDDYKNAVIGGMLAGSIFGYKSRFFTCLNNLVTR